MDDSAWKDFCNDIVNIIESIRDNLSGNKASYIPQLEKVDSNLFGISVVTVEGNIFEYGDYNEHFCIQSCSKPLTYALALQEHGIENVSHHIGREPSGSRFNAMCFDDENKPFNPLINAGAIMTCSLIKNGCSSDERYEYILNTWRSIVGKNSVGFDNGVYLSEKNTANRNYALAHLMMENCIFPEACDMEKTLELYFQGCSVTMNCTSLAKFAALLANGGKTVDTNESIFEPRVIKDVLCVMYSSGMYDYSGRWSFDIGLPAKSGVSGAIYVVIPNLCGICVYSPNLDEIGNSVRGVEFIKELSNRYKFHIFDTLVTGLNKKKQLKRKKDTNQLITEACAFCKDNDFKSLEKLIIDNNLDINIGDYDDRRALHIAVEDKNYLCVGILLQHNADAFVKDRWGVQPFKKAIENKDNISVLMFIINYYENNMRRCLFYNFKNNYIQDKSSNN